MSLKNMSAIVTGAGRDIGRACALRLAAEGANVALSYHSSSEGAESAVAEIKKIGGNACLLYTSPSPRDQRGSRMPSSA